MESGATKLASRRLDRLPRTEWELPRLPRSHFLFPKTWLERKPVEGVEGG